MHTFVPEIARGKGISSALAKFALEYVKEEQNLKLMAYCPVIVKYIKQRHGYEALIDKQYHRWFKIQVENKVNS